MTETCRAVEPLLIDVVVGQADTVDRQVVEEHLARCQACAAVRANFSASWRILDLWQVPPPPARAESTVFTRVRADLGAASVPRSIAGALGLGLVVASAMAWLVQLQAPVTGGGLTLLVCGGIWAVAFGLAFHVVLSHQPGRGVRAGLWASAGLVALSLACPVGNLADVCHGSTAFTALLGRGASAYFVAGLLYGLVPSALGLLATRGHGRRGLRAALPVSLVIAAFELPIFYLQCQPFAAGALATTLGGALLGASLATLTDLRWFGHGARTVS